MLIRIKRLLIENEGYKRNIYLKDFYINSSSIISISDYTGANDFLLREESNFSRDKFSLIKVNQGNKYEDVIAHGSAEEIYKLYNQTAPGRKLLND